MNIVNPNGLFGQTLRFAKLKPAYELKNTLLLLDEATSVLEAAMQHRTTLVVAHRLATIQKANRIVVLEASRVVDIGRHDELVAHGGLYAKLATMQFGLEA